MGQVLDVMSPLLGRVALKVAAGETEEQQLEHEHGVLGRLDHPCIPTAHDLHRVEGHLVMPMTRYAGVPFNGRREGDVPRRVVGIVSAVLDVLDHVHARGFAHRDLKSPNVLVDGRRICLVDFGVAQHLDEVAVDANGCVSGTAAFMAPELLDGGCVTASSDIYSVGIILYRWLTRRWPFPEDGMNAAKHRATFLPLTVLRPSLPHELDGIVASMLAAHPSARASDAEEVRGQLLALLPVLAADTSSVDLVFDDRPTDPTLPSVPPPTLF